jgi:2-C-methyl-D-erythritol 4-phosphate cytidylyltransferase
MKYHVVIPAAGQGKRMIAGKNKQFIKLGGLPLIAHTLSVFQNDSWCEGIVLAANPTEIEDMGDIVSTYNMTKVKRVTAGGKERQDSVYEGLKCIDSDGIVLIHDGARPFISVEAIHHVVIDADQSGAAVLAVPVKDTIKKVASGVITETLERSSLWAVQTPQAFRLPLIQQAHEEARHKGMDGTDDASLVEDIGRPVSIVKGDYQNIKLTTPDDLAFARMILENR